MSQSTKVFIALAFAFVLYISAKGEISAYLATVFPSK